MSMSGASYMDSRLRGNDGFIPPKCYFEITKLSGVDSDQLAAQNNSKYMPH